MQVWCTVLLQPGKPRDKRNLPRTSWRRCQDCPRTRVLLEVFRTCAVHITGPIFSCHLCRRVPLSIFESCTSLCQAIWLHKSIQQPQEVVLRRFFKKMSHSIPNLYKPLAASLVHFFATACRLSPDVLLSCCDMMSTAFPLIMSKAE